MKQKNFITVGTFDGVHLGHAALLRKTVERAQALGCTPAVFTFDKTDENFNLNNFVLVTYDGTKYSYNYDTTQDE